MTFSFKPPIRKWASLGLATCILAACHHQTQHGTAAADPGQPASGRVTQPQAGEPGSPAGTPGDAARAATNTAAASGTAPSGTISGPTAAPPTTGAPPP